MFEGEICHCEIVMAIQQTVDGSTEFDIHFIDGPLKGETKKFEIPNSEMKAEYYI